MSTLQRTETSKFQAIKKIPVIDHILTDEAAGLTEVSTKLLESRIN